MHMDNSQLVYNFYEQAIKLFLIFYTFYEIFGFITSIRKQCQKVNWRPLQFRKQVLLTFFLYSQNNFRLYWSYMLDFLLFSLKFCRF